MTRARGKLIARRQPKPWIFPAADNADIYAIKAMFAGQASAGQQQRFMELLLQSICEETRMSFLPGGDDGRRGTDFAEGKRWVALALHHFNRLRLQQTSNQEPTEPAPPTEEGS